MESTFYKEKVGLGQSRGLLHALREGSLTALLDILLCTLHCVSMGCVDISGVEAATLALGLNTLTVARLCNTSITTIQLEALLRSTLDHVSCFCL